MDMRSTDQQVKRFFVDLKPFFKHFVDFTHLAISHEHCQFLRYYNCNLVTSTKQLGLFPFPITRTYWIPNFQLLIILGRKPTEDRIIEMWKTPQHQLLNSRTSTLSYVQQETTHRQTIEKDFRSNVANKFLINMNKLCHVRPLMLYRGAINVNC